MSVSTAAGLGLSVSGRRWSLRPRDPRGQGLAEALGVSPVIGQLLIARGISDADEARAFLFGGREVLADPGLLPGMDAAVAHLREAIAARRKIWVYGDYDVDGVSATALLSRVLRRLGADVQTYIPSRFDEGYGLNRAALEEAAAGGVHTVVTVDCGVTAVEEAARARELGLRLVITDHHEPKGELPEAVAIINPKLPGSGYPFSGLSGAGVAFKLALALTEGREEMAWEEIDLVALATVADMVPLQGENRVLVRDGLAAMNREAGVRPGIAALAEVARLKAGQLTEYHLAYVLAPRINALGRLGSADEALELLLAEDEERAAALAARLDEENRRRQAIEGEIAKAAVLQAAEQVEQGRQVLVLAEEGWHIGVMGIVASRVVERFHRPTLMLSLEGEEARGSGRSLSGFHLFSALEACSDLLTRFGGHSQAAGLALERGRLPELQARLEEIAAREMTETDLRPTLRVDAEMAPDEVTEETARQLAALAPFGFGNPSPLLALRGVALREARRVGKEGTHLKLRFQGGGRLMDGIAFGLAEAAETAGVRVGHRVDVAAVPELNEWNGRLRVQLMVRDLGQPVTSAEEFEKGGSAESPAAPGNRAAAGAGIRAAAGAVGNRAAAGAAAFQPVPLPAPPTGAHYLWVQAQPRLMESGEWDPWDTGLPGPRDEAGARGASPVDLPVELPDPRAFRDLRGQNPREVLLDLASRGTAAVAVAAAPARALAIAAECAAEQPHLAASFLPYHARLPGALRALVLTEFRQRSAPILLTSWGGLGGLEPGDVETVILLDPPLSESGLQSASRLVSSTEALVCAWSDASASWTEQLVAAHSPDRQALADLYLLLKDLARRGQPITTESVTALGRSAATVVAALQVFTDLGLVSMPLDGDRNWAWLPAGQARLNLEDSITFRQAQRRKEEFLRLLGYFSRVDFTPTGQVARGPGVS